MAKGRMINCTITEDKRVNDLSSDTSRLAFTWLVTFCDCEGRVAGDPALIRSKLFPRRNDVTEEMIESYFIEWQSARDPSTGLGLVVWYEARGDRWLWFTKFEKNQVGLRKDKEAPSSIPEPPDVEHIVAWLDVTTTEPVRPYSVPTTDEVRTDDVNSPPEQNRTEPEQNRTEQNGFDGFCHAARTEYESRLGPIGTGSWPNVKQILFELYKRGFQSWWPSAVQISVEQGKHNNWPYTRGILKRCLDTGDVPVPKNPIGKEPEPGTGAYIWEGKAIPIEDKIT